jgi:ribose transport system substrate-binding protein
MLRALQDAGRAGKVKFVGFDSSEKLVDALKAGEIHGLVLQNPFRMGQLGVETLVQHLAGEKLPAVVDTGVRVATPENMDQQDVQALLRPDLSILAGNP